MGNACHELVLEGSQLFERPVLLGEQFRFVDLLGDVAVHPQVADRSVACTDGNVVTLQRPAVSEHQPLTDPTRSCGQRVGDAGHEGLRVSEEVLALLG